MRRDITSIILFILAIQIMSAQSRFGIEFKVSRVKTENGGKLEGGGGYFHSYEIIKEANPVTSGYSLGLVYKLNERNLLKLHLGRHQNGRILDLNSMDDAGTFNSYTAFNVPYIYSQVAPSYLFRLVNKKIIIPVEIGVNINKHINAIKTYVGINHFNFDFEVSAGLQYRLHDNFIAGVQGIYTGNLNEYQDKEYVRGAYTPKQYGLELSILYEFEKNNVH